MDPEIEGKIIDEHLLSIGTLKILKTDLNIYPEFIKFLQDEDFNRIESDGIYFSGIYSSASNSSIKVKIPANSQIITFDSNSLKRYSREERIAILLHELGHALNSSEKGENGEYVADDFVNLRGYDPHLKSSLEKSIQNSPTEFDKSLTRKRVERLQEAL